MAPPQGGFVVVLEADAESPYFPGDLLRIPRGVELPGKGLGRALLVSSPSTSPDAVPPSWAAVPESPFAVFEDAPPGTLPVSEEGLAIEALSATEVRVSLPAGGSTQVPRHWLARMLFRIALHGVRLGYLETYGGFYSDDRAGDLRLGIRGHGHVSIAAASAMTALERLYRAVAPPGYTERLD